MGKKVQQKKNFPVFTVFCIVMAVLIAIAIASTVVVQSGSELRNKTVMTVDDVEITGMDFMYAYRNAIDNYYYYYANMIYSYFGVTDFSATCYFDSSVTWATYIQNMAVDMVEDNLENVVEDLKGTVCLAVKAKSEGVTLSDENKETIEANVASITSTAESNNVSLDSYLSSYYGTGFKESDLRKMMEMAYLANQYKEALIATYEFTDADCETYYSENRTSFDSYTYYLLKAEYTTASDAAETSSDAVSSDATETSSDAVSSDATETSSDAASSDAAETMTKDEAKAYLENIMATVSDGATFAEAAGDNVTKVEGVKYSSLTSVDEVKTYVSDKDRKNGDMSIIEDDDALYLVQFISAERDEYNLVTLNMAEVVAEYETDATDEEKEAAINTAKETVQTKLDAWKASNGTRDTFIEMANELDTDLSSDGLVEDLIKGYFGDEFDAWAFDTARKEGDTIVFNLDQYVYVAYFVSQNEIAWKQTATDGLEDDKYDEDFDAIVESLKDKITVYQDVAEDIVG